MFLTSKNWVEVQLLPYQLNSQPCDVGVWSYRTPMVIANSLSTPPAFCTWCPRRHANKGECIARPVSSLRLCHSTTHDGEKFSGSDPRMSSKWVLLPPYFWIHPRCGTSHSCGQGFPETLMEAARPNPSMGHSEHSWFWLGRTYCDVPLLLQHQLPKVACPTRNTYNWTDLGLVLQDHFSHNTVSSEFKIWKRHCNCNKGSLFLRLTPLRVDSKGHRGAT